MITLSLRVLSLMFLSALVSACSHLGSFRAQDEIAYGEGETKLQLYFSTRCGASEDLLTRIIPILVERLHQSPPVKISLLPVMMRDKPEEHYINEALICFIKSGGALEEVTTFFNEELQRELEAQLYRSVSVLKGVDSTLFMQCIFEKRGSDIAALIEARSLRDNVQGVPVLLDGSGTRLHATTESVKRALRDNNKE
jgi:hypothetical protein